MFKCPSSIWCWDSNPYPLEHEPSAKPLDQGSDPAFKINRKKTKIMLYNMETANSLITLI